MTQDRLALTVPADDAAVARVARRFCAAYVEAEAGWVGGDGLHLMAERDAALADLLLVAGFADAYEGSEHDDRPEMLVCPDPQVL